MAGDISFPTGFLKIPSFDYIGEKPNEPYDFPTNGVIHANKFKTIITHLLEKDNFDPEDFLNGHLLEQQISQLNKKEVADFCRHVLILNKDKLDWEIVDDLLYRINELYLASWDLPDFVFTKDFEELYSSIIRWEPHQETRELFLLYIEETDIPFISKQDILKKLNSNYTFWTIKELWLLFDGYIEQYLENRKLLEPYELVKEKIEELLSSFLYDPNFPVNKKIALLSLFVRSYSKLKNEKILEIQKLVDQIWISVENSFDTHKILSYRYLYSINYANIGRYYYHHNIDYITKEKLINRIISSFINFEGMNIEEWLNYFVKSETDSLTIDFVLTGYSTIVSLLFDYTLELPDCDKRTTIIELIKRLSKTLCNNVIKYLNSFMEDGKLTPDNMYKLLKLSKTNKTMSRVIKGLLNVFINTFEYKVYLNIQQVDNFEDNMRIYIKSVNNLLNGNLAKIRIKHLKILTRNYPFEKLYESIIYETDKTNTVVTSLTFEEEIIGLISNTMDYIMKEYRNTKTLNISLLELLVFYGAEWLNYFHNKNLYQDAIMILSPIISVCLVQLAQGYYENKMTEKTLLIFVVMQHFSSIIRSEMDLIYEQEGEKRPDYLTSEFEEMIKSWKIDNYIDISLIEKRVKQIEISFSENKNDEPSVMDEEIMEGFEDLVKNLELFLTKMKLDKSNLVELTQVLFEPPNKENLSLFGKIGLVKEDSDYLPFPLISNINKYSSALSVVPLEIELPKDVTEINNVNISDFLIS